MRELTPLIRCWIGGKLLALYERAKIMDNDIAQHDFAVKASGSSCATLSSPRSPSTGEPDGAPVEHVTVEGERGVQFGAAAK
jgi:hypothetical protein